ncbi:MAG: metallophosphoesterase [Planctomycetota bacterium]
MKQKITKTTMLCVLMLLCVCSAVLGEVTVVVVPDPQKYSLNLPTADYPEGIGVIFSAQTEWIVTNSETMNIVFTSYVGDMVDNGPDLAQWDIADSAMGVLDVSGVPYGVCIGNHDTHYGYSADPYQDFDSAATNFITVFGLARFAGKIWYHGVSPTQRSSYQIIAVDGQRLLFLHLSIDTPQVELDWAQQVIDQNPDKLVVVSTHRYLYDFRIMAGRYGDGRIGIDDLAEQPLASGRYDPEGIWPEELFETFIKTNRNIFLVLSGHCHGEYYQVSYNNWDLPVLEVMVDYQDGANGGNGWLRTMTFDFEAGTVQSDTYSPTLDRYRTVAEGFVETIYIISLYMDSFPLPPEEKAILMAQLQADIPDFEKDPAVEAYINSPEIQAWLSYIGMNYAWDGLWITSFASGQRDPSFAYSFDPDAYTKRGDLNDDGQIDHRDIRIVVENLDRRTARTRR